MFKIQVLSPFRYVYHNADNVKKKELYLAAGSYYYLDSVKDKQEIKYILSNNFAFKNYIYVNETLIPSDIKAELELEQGSFEVYTLPEEKSFTEDEFKVPSIDVNFDDYEPEPIMDATPNYFDEQINSYKVSLSKDNQIQENDQKVEEESNKVKETEVEFKDVDYDKRKEELTSLNYKKVKEISEHYDIEYENKKQAISKILEIEFS